MRGTIRKIHPAQRSRNGNSYIRVEFKMEGGGWAKSDLCPDFRNFERWRNLLVVGKDLTGLIVKSPHEVDADSFPEKFVNKVEGEWIEHEDGSREFIKKERPVEITPLPPVEEIQPKLL